MDEWTKMRGSQIPAFGNWDYVNEMPITQYFECARQAGLIRYSSSSGECEHNNNNNNNYNNTTIPASPDLYSLHYVNPPPHPRSKQGKGREKRSVGTHVREGNRKQAGKVYDVRVTELPKTAVKKKQTQSHYQYDAGLGAQPCRAPKAVDEDLYQIPPELLKRKRRMGFFSRCLVPPCAV
ncbi:uncharacterized protein LOC141657632 [Silene latifolia]|uniref:uncharacterized protein LOC141657632 n=1 Tax=Silene latifolia TaxID=37657 RepID=UPI003D76AF70